MLLPQFIYQDFQFTTLYGQSTSASLATDLLTATIHYDVTEADTDSLYDRCIATLTRF